MKKSYIILVLICITTLLASCNKTPPVQDRVIVKEFGISSNGMMSYVADINNIEAITELSTHIVKCKVNKMTKTQITDTDSLNFEYSVEIQDIFLNVGNSLKVGDTITITTGQGIVKASEAAELFKNNAHAQKFGYLQDDYADNEYIISTDYEAIPIEVGKSYIMYLYDGYLADYGLYAENSRMFLYEYTDGVLYSGKDYKKMDISYKKFVEQLKDSISARTGRADEIGYDAYVDELGEKQAKQWADLQAAD